jgi:hypothetical protein
VPEVTAILKIAVKSIGILTAIFSKAINLGAELTAILPIAGQVVQEMVKDGMETELSGAIVLPVGCTSLLHVPELIPFRSLCKEDEEAVTSISTTGKTD